MQLIEHIRRRLPLVALGAGAGAMFLSNVVARWRFSPEQFVDWAYITSLVAFFFSFSLLGSEQLIVRSAMAAAGRLQVPAQAARYIAASFAVFLGAYVLLLDGRIFSYRLGVAAIPVLLSIGAIQVVYQLERARGQLFAAQLAFNAWKFALLPLVLLASVALRDGRAEFAMAGSLVAGLLVVAAVYLRARGAVALHEADTDAGQVYLPFMLSLGVMGALGIADRVVLEKVHHPDAFAGYVYLVTILATPFNILSSYFGFKEAVRYRGSYSVKMVRRDTLRTMSVAGALVVGWSVFCYVTRSFSGVAFDSGTWLLLGVLSIVRCGYGVLSAAMGVRGSAPAIYGANAVTVAALAIFAFSSIASGASIVGIAAGFTVVWVVRCVAYFWLIGALPSGSSATQDVHIA